MSANANLSGPIADLSHTYDSDWSKFLRGMLVTLATCGLIGVMTMTVTRFGWLPRSSFRSDPDSMIIATKVMLARESKAVELALVGDSSCSMNLDVSVLKQALGTEVRNLGTLSFLGIDSFGKLAKEFAQGKSSVKVALVLHPEALRLVSTSEPHEEILASALGNGEPVLLKTNNPVAAYFGWNGFQARVLDRWVPGPLPGGFGLRYGFTECLERELWQRAGSVDETSKFNASTNRVSAEYRLANRIKKECESFRRSLPPNARVRLIISPVPQSHALRSHETKLREIRSEVEQWVGAEQPSWNLPLVLPDADFGTVTHLLPEAAVRYSRRVAEAISQWK